MFCCCFSALAIYDFPLEIMTRTKKCVVSFYSEVIDNLKIFNQFNSFINFIFAFLSYVLHKPGHCYPVAVITIIFFSK